MNNHYVRIKRKRSSNIAQVRPSITTYDHAMGVIRIIDTTIDSNLAPSISPVSLTRSLKRDIKKTVGIKKMLNSVEN